MSAELESQGGRIAGEQAPEPDWIESPGGPLFAWYHPPSAPLRSTAVLLCDPLFSDRMNLHLSYRYLALRLAERGYPALRVDYAGTGDSSGSPRDPGWSENLEVGLHRALDRLLERSGVERAALFGARFGGTIAARFAATRPEFDSLMLWGPYASGREFLRSERAMHRLVRAGGVGRPAEGGEAPDEEFVGYVLTREARPGIEDYRLLEAAEAPCRRIHLVAWDAHSAEQRLAEHWTGAGATVELTRIDGLDSATSITRQAVPELLISALIDRLDQTTTTRSATGEVARSAEPGAVTGRVRRSAASPSEVVERAAHFGRDAGLFGILTTPNEDREAEPSPRPRLILVNGGNNHRAGINRNYTEWARDAALQGFSTLRFDIRGLGDSPPRDRANLNALYRRDTFEDVRASIDFLETNAPGGPIVLCGLCAGAYQALHATYEDDRVHTLVLLDLLKWDPDAPNKRARGFFARRKRQLARWLAASRSLLRRGTPPEPSSLGRGLLELTGRGVAVVAVGCRGGGGFKEFEEAIDSVKPRLLESGRFRLEGLAETDHIFSPVWAQQFVSNLLLDVLAESDRTMAARIELAP